MGISPGETLITQYFNNTVSKRDQTKRQMAATACLNLILKKPKHSVLRGRLHSVFTCDYLTWRNIRPSRSHKWNNQRYTKFIANIQLHLHSFISYMTFVILLEKSLLNSICLSQCPIGCALLHNHQSFLIPHPISSSISRMSASGTSTLSTEFCLRMLCGRLAHGHSRC